MALCRIVLKILLASLLDTANKHALLLASYLLLPSLIVLLMYTGDTYVPSKLCVCISIIILATFTIHTGVGLHGIVQKINLWFKSSLLKCKL